MTMEIISPPEKRFRLSKHRSVLGAKRRREAELEKERARKERVARENRNGVGCIAGRKRAAKNAKRGRTANNSTI